MRRGYIAATVVCIAIALAMLSMVSPVLSSTADFSIFNTGWNGTSSLAVSTYKAGKFSPSFELRSTGGDVEFIRHGLDEIELDPASDALAIIGPTTDFSESEGAIVGDFVREGGNLILADDFGTANTLLEGMGAGSRFSGKLVIDLSFGKSPEFPICYDIVPDALTTNVTSLQLNYATSITVNGLSETLARTSVASWSDTDGDRTQELGEPSGPFSVLVRERLGAGEIMLLSDPSMLINGMREHLDNEVFASNLVSVVSDGRSGLYFDESHRNYFDPVTIGMELTGTVSGNAKAALLAIAFVLALWITTNALDRGWSWAHARAGDAYRYIFARILRRKAKASAVDARSIDEIIGELSRTHPGWSEGLLRYIVREKNRHEAHMERRD